MKPEYRKNKKYYMDTESIKIYIKTEDIFVDIAKDVEKRSDTSNYNIDRPEGNNKNVIGLTEGE